jgi:hypothetical protein
MKKKLIRKLAHARFATAVTLNQMQLRFHLQK